MLNTNATHGANFIFTMSSNKLQTASFFVNEFTGLGMSFSEIVPHLWQGQQVKRPGDLLTFNDMSLTILMDEDYGTLQEIYDFMAVTTKDMESNNLEWDSNFTGVLYLSTNRNNLKKKIEFKNCWFKDMNDVVLSTTLTEDTPVLITITVACDSYTIQDV